MGHDLALTVHPLSDVDAVRSALGLTRQARAALGVAGPPPLDGIPDVRPALARAHVVGTTLDGAELVLIRTVLQSVPALAAHSRAIREVAPDVAALSAGLPHLSDLLATLTRALDDEGGLTDEASSRLGSVRRELRSRRRRLVQMLERLLNGPDADRIFAERFVTLRHGRYVLPVRAEARSRVRGIVHDRSQSGQTLFVEPADVVEANNDLVQWTREEAEEAARVLAELTDAVRDRLPDLDALVDGLAELDWLFARARSAERMQATVPALDTARIVRLHAARHPLLVAQSWNDPSRVVVPMDLELSADRPLLLITGPNAGGKTVALKTLALCALMAQTGCHVPAADGSRLPVFDSVHAVIGDEQSVAENLSTFSAFVKQAREILDEAGPGSLVLLDELGAGTDPDEGAALARAMLEALDASGALVVASTHLEPLKAFASTYPRARNASVEFDAEALAPTFRLRYDRPGQSYALAIAARLGLPADVIARAREHRSSETTRVSELLERLDQDARREASRALAAETREREATARLEGARDAEAAAKTRAREIVDRAKAEAAALLGDVRRAVNQEWERLKRTERSRRTLDESRRRIGDVAARVAPVSPPEPAHAPVDLAPGTAVRADHLGLRGEVIAVSGATATVRAGSVTVRVPVSALRLAETDALAGRGISGEAIADVSRAGGETTREPVGPTARRAGRVDLGRARDTQAGSRVVSPPGRDIPSEILLLGKTTDEARDIVEQYLDDAFVAGLGSVRLVHGRGTGALRKAVRELLDAHPLVESFRDGEPSEGGTGATVAELRVS